MPHANWMGMDCVLCFLFYILLALSFNLLISVILSPTPFQLQAIKFVGKDQMSGKTFFTWHLEFLPSFRFLIKYKKSELLCIYFFFNLPHRVSLRVGEISVGSQTGSSSLGIHSFFLSFFALSSSLIALQSMIYRFYFFFNLLDKSLMLGISPKSQTYEKQKIEKTHAKEKQSHAQDNIYVVRQFVYIYGIAGISLLSEKNTEYKNCDYNTFFSHPLECGNNNLQS